MTSTKKPLYIASDIDELQAKWDDINTLIKNKSNAQILASARKLLDGGNDQFMQGDEENAFVLYGRYVNILVQIQKRNSAEAKRFISLNLGGMETTNRVMKRLEELRDSLEARYREKNGCKSLTLPSMEITPVQVELPIEQQPPRLTISCCELYNMMEKESSKFIILDCRTEEDFDRSKINFTFTCNVPETLCCIGMTTSKVEKNLPNESQVVWTMRKDRPITVLIDWFSTSFIRNSPIWHLREILTEWDEECEKKSEMVLLEGGFERWLLTYPMKCSDPHVKPPNQNKILAPSMDVEYPNIEDIVMKDDAKKTPSVDRSTKGNAMRNYEENLSQKDLLERKLSMLDKTLQNDEELMMLEDQYLSSNKENEEESSQSVLYKIMELQAKQKDTKIETDKIDEDLEISRKLPSQPSDASKLKSVEDEVRRKEIEAKKRAEELSHKQRRLDEMLERARASKPNFDKTPIKTPRKSELILSPRNLNSQSIPSVNRASKPTTQFISSQKDYDNQDFSPVYGRVDRGLTGLKNLGNSCYMNSILQCLSNTISLTHFILEGAYEKYINRETKGQVIRTLAALIKMLWRGDCKYISSKHLKEVIGKQADLFYGCEQQDAHEFLILLIDWLQSDLQTIHMPLDPHNENASEKAWLEYTRAKESYILRLFYGQIKSTLKCTMCGEESATFDTFSNLSLELPPSEIDSCKLEHCFNSYFHGERISGWNCPKCKAPRDAVKKLDISKLPPVLIIHLKRFYADPNFSCSSYKKKTCKVDFPLERLDMLCYVAPKERANIAASARPYKLYAVSNHYGTLDAGHYTAFCFNTTKKRWYKFDDTSVSSIDTSEVISSSAYVLFYTNLHENNYNMN